MVESETANKMQHSSTSASIALGAALVSSTLFLVGAAIVSVGCLIASTQSISTIQESTDDNIRIMFWGFLSLLNAIVLYLLGIGGLIKTMRGYKDLKRVNE